MTREPYGGGRSEQPGTASASWEWLHTPPAPSPQSRRLAATLSKTLRPIADRLGTGPREVRFARMLFDTLGRGRRPSDVARTRTVMGAIPAIHLAPRTAVAGSESAVLYVHGGGFVFGSARSHAGLAAWLAHHSGMPVWLPDYRRAPEDPFPAARDDVLAAYRYLLGTGIPAARIALVGDSAGAHIIAEMLVQLAGRKLPVPGAVVLFSPLLDLTGESMFAADRLHRDPFASPRYALRAGAAYLNGTAPRDPLVDVLDGELPRWPRTLIQIGDTECMVPAAEHFADRLRNAGTPVALQIWPGQVHVFQSVAARLPEGRAALRETGAFLAAQMAAAAPSAAS
ncbi:alpha/beta hydrolase [Nocardia tengchongensis]